MGNELREGNAKLSAGNGVIFLHHSCIRIPGETLSLGAPWVSEAMCAVNFTIAFAFEIKLTGGNVHILEIIVVTSDGRQGAYLRAGVRNPCQPGSRNCT